MINFRGIAIGYEIYSISTELYRISISPAEGQNPAGANTGTDKEASQRSSHIREENFAVAEKNLDFLRTGLARYCQKVRKGLPKLCWGSKKHAMESGSGVFAQDSEVEREEVYINEKKIIQTSSRFRVKIAETRIAH